MNSVRRILSNRHGPLGQVDHADCHIQTVGDVVKDVLVEPLAPDNAPRAVPDEPVGALAFRQAIFELRALKVPPPLPSEDCIRYKSIFLQVFD